MKYFYTFLLLFLMLGVTLAADEAGGRAGAYLRMPADARSAALGNAGSTILNDVNMVNGNPAVLSSIEEKQFSSSFMFLSLDRSYQSLAFAAGLPPRAGMTASWIHAGVDNIEGRNYSNDYTYNYSWSQNAFVIGFGIRVLDWLSLGISGKILSDNLINSVSSGFSADIGAIVSPLKNLNLGFVYKDLSGKVTWDTSAESYAEFQTRRVDSYPAGYHLAFSYLLSDRYLFAGTYKFSNEIEPTWHLGVEARLGEGIFLRAGVDDSLPTLGFGTQFVVWDNIVSRMDYAFIAGRVNDGSSHLFTWFFYF
ncbi:MAG: hypothetical protein R6V48_03260 [Fidelibacterota bacterium]